VGWLPADGSAVSRIVFADLFAVIGTTHGHGDAVTTFNLPDYRGRFLRGVDGGAGRDPDRFARGAMAAGGNVGDAVGTVQSFATRRPNTNSNTISIGNHGHGVGSGGTHSHSVGFGGTHNHGIGDVVRPTPNNDGDLDGTPDWAAQFFGQSTFSAGSHNHLMGSAGSHGHSVGSAGGHLHAHGIGDNETRPMNAYVNWIIKY
jgi:microcystin-dependent protein